LRAARGEGEAIHNATYNVRFHRSQGRAGGSLQSHIHPEPKDPRGQYRFADTQKQAGIRCEFSAEIEACGRAEELTVIRIL
jgi:hypothetical protein